MDTIPNCQPIPFPFEYTHPFFFLRKIKCINTIDDQQATVSRSFLVALLQPFISRIAFDPAFYRITYPDLAIAEDAGTIHSLHDHYLNYGFFEDRLPCHVPVDGSYYAREYPDVAVAILENRIDSAQSHFESVGFREGRLPSRNWSFSSLLSGS